MHRLQAILEAIIVITIMFFFYGLIKISLMAYNFIM
jgi:hypothetical protein